MRWHRDLILIGVMMVVVAVLAYVLTSEAGPPLKGGTITGADSVTPSASSADDSSTPTQLVDAASSAEAPSVTPSPQTGLTAMTPISSPSATTGAAVSTSTTQAPEPLASPTSPAAVPSPAVSPMAMDSTPPPRVSPAAPRPASAASLLKMVAEREAALKVGYLTATLSYPTGDQARVDARFDLRDSSSGPRWQSTTTYAGVKGSSTTDLISVGNQAWQREGQGPWHMSPEEEPPSGRLLSYLPDVGTTQSADVQSIDAQRAVLKWHDTAQDADVALLVSASTGTPLQYTVTSQRTKSVLTVSYLGWNSDVSITPPAS